MTDTEFDQARERYQQLSAQVALGEKELERLKAELYRTEGELRYLQREASKESADGEAPGK